MKKMIITYNQVEGYHFYPEAPKDVSFLSHMHRHIFIIICKFDVKDSNREIEVIRQQTEIESLLQKSFGKPAKFGSMSCEMIGEFILSKFEKCVEVKVLEDNFGGAIIQR